MLLVWNGTWRVAIWYRMQPAAQMSAFSVYGSFFTSSGLCCDDVMSVVCVCERGILPPVGESTDNRLHYTELSLFLLGQTKISYIHPASQRGVNNENNQSERG